ncbi:tyrosinase family protein [Noviherbaspirillum sp. CPCC 100848]|uniref:Tyrosinase family protein n=1 Tax=Noviherbaspirillum album TaxID=3080276 RepID=A0ABU6JDB1_9BURK|nr:tyrosinase family protein [Noviherbaspirillum sp. CPCC 100848]MEC4721628.1 tyrosinase family protein [Noviherbaspirillum sp. CPCC 100848]
METQHISRRRFVKGAFSAIAIAALPARSALAQSTIWTRLEWQQFRSSPQYASFLDAIRLMRANNNAADPSSWRYWTDLHMNAGLHGVPYFLSWHRAYIHHFEQRLRTVSGNSQLTLPYWDYYKNPNVPAEFTDPSSNNPLYVNRVNTNVYDSLTLAPFQASIVNFQRGTSNAFEVLLEWGPHNPVHNIIGGYMAGMDASMDPIFWLHHCNIDRLWHAWALPDGKNMPWYTDPYWSGSFNFGSGMSTQRDRTYHINWMNYHYDDLTRPSTFPPRAEAARMVRVQMQTGRGSRRPAAGAFTPAGPRDLGGGRRSLGGARNISLADVSTTVQVPIEAAGRQQLQSALARGAGAAASGGNGQYRSVRVALESVRMNGQARNGGFYYNVYANLPEDYDAESAQLRNLLGVIGPFEIAAAEHHGGGNMSFPATGVLAGPAASDAREVSISLVRVGGRAVQRGQSISIGEIRVELSTEEPNQDGNFIRKPASACYC